MSLKSRLSSSFPRGGSNHNRNDNVMNDASPPQFDVDDNEGADDNEKDSKIQRTSQRFLVKSIVGLLLFFFMATYLQQYAEEKQQQQQQQIKTSASKKVVLHPNKVRDSVSAFKTKYLTTDYQLSLKVKELDTKVRARKATKGIIMETDPEGLQLTKQLQEATKALLRHRYGSLGPFRIQVDITYPDSIPSDSSNTRQDYFIFETGPADLIPCSVFYFLELARTYQSGSIHRNAGHVLQVQVQSKATQHHQPMPFQEYHPDFPHAQYTLGYAGRPSGPGWYVSIEDNTKNHGPGSQQNHNPYEADSLFGKLVLSEKQDDDSTNNEDDDAHDNVAVIQKIHTVPQMGWLDPPNHIKIDNLTILKKKKKKSETTKDDEVGGDDEEDDEDEDEDEDEDGIDQWIPLAFPTNNHKEEFTLVMQ